MRGKIEEDSEEDESFEDDEVDNLLDEMDE